PPDKTKNTKRKKDKDAVDYEVGDHPVKNPRVSGGESHHVPFKVFKRWIGEILVLAGRAMGKEAIEEKGAEYRDDTVGEGLSAIWLSEKAHAAVHESAKPGELDVKGDFVVKTEKGDISSRPMRSTIARTVHEGLDLDTSKADDKDSRNKEIYE